jgi:allantoate deiminase
MLFVRCRGGVSHNPAEAVAQPDVAAAIAALGHFLEETAACVTT